MNVFLIAESLQHIKNWAREMKIDLPAHPNIRWASKDTSILGSERGGYFVIITWPSGGEKITRVLKARDYKNLPPDINEWPIEAFR